MVQYHEWIFIPPRILQVMNHKISVRRQNLIQKLKKKIPSSFDYFDFSDISIFFSKIVPHLSQIFVFSFSIFFGNFSSNKKFHERKKLIRELKKEKKKKIKREEEKKTLPKCVLVSFNAVNTIFRNTFVH